MNRKSRRKPRSKLKPKWGATISSIINSQAGKWSMRAVCVLGFGVVVMSLIQWSSDRIQNMDSFTVNSVKIEGSFQHVSAEQARKIVEPYVEDSFFGIDVDSIKHAIQDQAWVKSVSVRRVWPDVLHIRMEEQTPFARWGEKGLINPDGTSFFPAFDSIPTNLPQLQGPPKSEFIVMKVYQEMSAVLSSIELQITRLAMDERRAWQLTLDNGIKLVLGRKGSKERLKRFVRFYPAIIPASESVIDSGIDTVDMRYSNGFVVRWSNKRTHNQGQANVG